MDAQDQRVHGLIRRAVVTGLALLLGALVAVVGGPVPASAQADPPTLVVDPSTELLDGQTVQLTGTGFLASTTVYVVMCPPGATNGFDCDLTGLPSSVTDASGAFSRSFQVRRIITGTVGGVLTDVDCALVTCTIAVGDIDQVRVAQTPVQFTDVPLPPADVSVSPVGGDRLAGVSGTGWRTFAVVRFRQCPPGTTDPARCEAVGSATTDGTGSFATSTRVERDLFVLDGGVPSTHDCKAGGCTLVAEGGGRSATAPLDLTDYPDQPVVVTASPTDDLVDGAVVDLTGAGFVPDQALVVRQCSWRPLLPGSCLADGATILESDATGGLAGSPTVRRDVLASGSPLAWDDCALAACFLLVTGGGDRRVVIPLGFADAPRPALDPRLAIAPGSGPDRYVVSGTGFPLGGRFTFRTCRTSVCAAVVPTTDPVAPDAQGALSLEVEIARFGAFGASDCLLQPCVVQARYGAEVVATSPRAPVPAPELTISIDPFGTLSAATGEAVASATIQCDVATPVSVVGSVAQPGVEGGYAFANKPCSPTEPLRAFIPTRTFTVDDADLALGPAEVTVTATPHQSNGVGTPTVATSPATLLDDDATVAVVGAALADPAEVELRAEFLRAVKARLAQDPVFARQWWAAIFGR